VDPGPFYYTVITVYHLLALFTFLQNITFYHSIHLILYLQQTGEIDNLTDVAAGAKLCLGRGAIYKLSGAIVKLDGWRIVDYYYGQAVGKLQAESMISTSASLFPQ
jgi:hypothetical protein